MELPLVVAVVGVAWVLLCWRDRRLDPIVSGLERVLIGAGTTPVLAVGTVFRRGGESRFGHPPHEVIWAIPLAMLVVVVVTGGRPMLAFLAAHPSRSRFSADERVRAMVGLVVGLVVLFGVSYLPSALGLVG